MSLGSTKLRDVAAAPRRVVQRGRAPKPRASARVLTSLGAAVLRLVRAYPARSGAVVVVGALMGGIVGNAVLFQKGRHPAPLFGGALRSAATEPSQNGKEVTTGSVPLPLPRPSAPVASPADPQPAPADAAPQSVAAAPLHTRPPPAAPAAAKAAPLPPLWAAARTA